MSPRGPPRANSRAPPRVDLPVTVRDRGSLGDPLSIPRLLSPPFRGTDCPGRATRAERRKPRGGPRTGARARGGGAPGTLFAPAWPALFPRRGLRPSPLLRFLLTPTPPVRRSQQRPPRTSVGRLFSSSPPPPTPSRRPNTARPPASRARLPPSMAPSNAPGIARRPSSPPRPQRRRAGGRARVPPKAGLVARVRARKRPSYLGELHHDGGRGRRRRAWRASSSQKSELSGTRRKWTAVAGGEGSGARTTACQLQLASEAKD